jgi:hypothetical protein
MYKSFIVLTRDIQKAENVKSKIYARVSKYIIPDSFSFPPDKRILLMTGGNGVGKTTLFHALDASTIAMERKAREAAYERKKKWMEEDENFRSRCKEETLGEPTFSADPGGTAAIIVWSNSAFNMRTMHSEDEIGSSMANFYNFVSTKEVSEGQAVVQTADQFFASMRAFAKKEPAAAATDNVCLIDEIDSGLSIENIDWAASEIRRDAKLFPHTQFFVFYNSYELYKKLSADGNAIALSMYDGKPVSFGSYEEYASFIRKNQKAFCHGRFLDAKNGKEKAL